MSLLASRYSFFVNGSQHVTLYRWIRMHISKVKSNIGQCQFAEIQILDKNNNVYVWPNGTTCHNTTIGVDVGTFGTYQKPDKLIDGNISTKMCIINIGSYKYFDVDMYIDLGAAVFDPRKWCKWRWYTADDNAGRDPVSFSLYLSIDAENWIPVDADTEVTVTGTRGAIAYTGDIDLNLDYARNGLVAWWDGIWNAGIGVHDSNAASWVDLVDGTAYALVDTGSWDDNSRIHSASYCFLSTRQLRCCKL